MSNTSNKNFIIKSPIAKLGYDFIPAEYLPKGKNEYYLRNSQERSGRKYRHLTAYETEVLVRNNNTSDNWNNIFVSEFFNPELIKNCKFNGLIRIGKLEAVCLTFSDHTTPVGLYNSNIISCDFGDNVVVENVNYLSHYIIGNEVILQNIHEMITSSTAKFGNGIIKQGEDESKRVWLEISNENGGRKVMPFNGMQPADAYLWSKYRDDEKLLEKLIEFTEKKFLNTRGFYGKVGDRCVIKNTRSIKDVWIGEDAYIKGANKLKNLTINSGNNEGKTQIGEGCELVNGIIGYGCRIFYGVKAVRFVTSDHSQLKYGARLINSFLGYNSTISCCEVLNSLIFSSHEQHHNNSFLCAATLLGQSNLAAGATIGSNHNSRGADGEVIAGRGFWPGLCVSLKHNSKFASFTILSKGDYATELNITIPFSLVSNDVTNDKLVIMPAYWFMYNMYALARNEWKYYDRDKRNKKIQEFEYSSLAPDTIDEIYQSLKQIEFLVGHSFSKINNLGLSNDECVAKGKELLVTQNTFCDAVEVDGFVFENAKRKTILVKVAKAYHTLMTLISYYTANCLINFVSEKNFDKHLLKNLPAAKQFVWLNFGGQLIPTIEIDNLKSKIKSGKIKTWDDVHSFYKNCSKNYNTYKLQHALYIYKQINNLKSNSQIDWKSMLLKAIETKRWITKNIEISREKDYTSEFRKMVYDNAAEMDKVLGSFADNSFIKSQKAETVAYTKKVNQLIKNLNL